jgi:hypothetical protein
MAAVRDAAGEAAQEPAASSWVCRRSVARLASAGAFANDEAEFLRRLEERAKEGQLRYPGLQLSAGARLRSRPSPPPRDATFRDEGQVWNEFMPKRKVYRIAATHDDIGGAATARLMQSIFDAPVA